MNSRLTLAAPASTPLSGPVTEAVYPAGITYPKEAAVDPRTQDTGTCLLCGRELTRAGMSRHLVACRKANRAREPKSRKRARPAFALVVTGSPYHWLCLEATADATLADLDAFLRRTWLECCGHFSAFYVTGVQYLPVGCPLDPWMGDQASMEVPLGEVLRPKLSFSHEYDFGSTTRCELRVTAQREAPLPGRTIEIQARNVPPVFPCDRCGRPATHVCTECINDDEGWFCERCAKGHDCGEEMLLPVVDSPHVGVCGYCG